MIGVLMWDALFFTVGIFTVKKIFLRTTGAIHTAQLCLAS